MANNSNKRLRNRKQNKTKNPRFPELKRKQKLNTMKLIGDQ